MRIFIAYLCKIPDFRDLWRMERKNISIMSRVGSSKFQSQIQDSKKIPKLNPKVQSQIQVSKKIQKLNPKVESQIQDSEENPKIESQIQNFG